MNDLHFILDVGAPPTEEYRPLGPALPEWQQMLLCSFEFLYWRSG